MMEGLEEKLGAMLNDPQTMQKIMAMAQSLGANAQPESPPPAGVDINMLQKLSSLSSQSSIDKNQQTLLRALAPYLSRQRINKLENAMRAAKMAGFAAAALKNNPSGGR